MALVLNGDGNVTGLTPGGLPDASITQADLASGVAGNGPAFAAYGTVASTPSINTFTKLLCNTEYFDTANAYDNSTNYRFQPQIAGYYQINAAVHYISAVSRCIISIYKNGSDYVMSDVNSSTVRLTASCILYLNGSTDYVEAYTYNGSGGTAVYNDTDNQFSGALVRAA